MADIDKLAEAIHRQSNQSAPTIYSTREMTSLDDLTDNFLGDPAVTRHFLAKFGQVFLNGNRYTV